MGALFRGSLRARTGLSVRIGERRIERCGQVVRLSVIGDSSDEEFIAEAIRMGSASQENEQASHFRFAVNDFLPIHNERSCQRAMKPGAIAVHVRIKRVEHLNLQNCTFGQSGYGVSGGRMKTCLHVKLENCPGCDSKWRNAWRLAVSGIRQETDGAQNHNQETRHHGLGPFFLEKQT